MNQQKLNTLKRLFYLKLSMDAIHQHISIEGVRLKSSISDCTLRMLIQAAATPELSYHFIIWNYKKCTLETKKRIEFIPCFDARLKLLRNLSKMGRILPNLPSLMMVSITYICTCAFWTSEILDLLYPPSGIHRLMYSQSQTIWMCFAFSNQWVCLLREMVNQDMLRIFSLQRST